MRQKSITVNGVGTSNWIPVDYKQSPFSLSISVTVTGPSVYTIEYTLDDLSNVTNIYKHPVLQSRSVNTHDGFTQPIRAFRLVNSSGVGSTTATYMQGLR